MSITGIAHRGYSAKFTENTVTALQAAVDLGFSHVEFDVQLTKDRVPVLAHDSNLTRLAGIDREVDTLTLNELRSIELVGGERIATLEEALHVVQGGITAMVEIKQMGDRYPGLEEMTLDLLRETGVIDDCIIISFDHFAITRLRRLDGDVPLGLTSSCAMPYVFGFMAETGCSHLGVPIRMMTDEYNDLIVRHGHSVGPWMVDTVEQMEFIADRFPHSLITTNELERWADFHAAHPEVQAGQRA